MSCDYNFEQGHTTFGTARLGSKTWIMDGESIFPRYLERKMISKCSLEFVDTGPLPSSAPECLERLVHCILRLTLKHAQASNASFAPIGTKSLVLDVTELNAPPITASVEWVPVKIFIKACTYEGSHRDAMKVIDLPVTEKKTVKDFLRVLGTPGLDTCQFICIEDCLFGCRDFQ